MIKVVILFKVLFSLVFILNYVVMGNCDVLYVIINCGFLIFIVNYYF